MRRSTSALSMGMEEYRPDDLEEFWVSDVPVVHAAWVIRPCALDRFRLDAYLPQDSAHPRRLHAEQCRQFQNRDSHFGNLLWSRVVGSSIIRGEFSTYTSPRTIYFSSVLWYIPVGRDLFV